MIGGIGALVAGQRRTWHNWPMAIGKMIAQSAAVRAMLSGAVRATRLKRAEVEPGASALAGFTEYVGRLKGGRVVELGTRRVGGAAPTTRRDWVPAGVDYIGCDFEAGADVEIVADAESLSQTFGPASIDAVIACSVFEHIRRPWIAAAEIGKVLRPGGQAFIQTHNAFPVHGHPHDYWRFSREALETLFSAESGFCSRQSWYEYPAMIVSGEAPLIAMRPAFLNVNIVAVRA